MGLWLGTFLNGGHQEGGDTKRLHSTGQTSLHWHLETSVCPIFFTLLFSPRSKVQF
jgi:hypothetical protein